MTGSHRLTNTHASLYIRIRSIISIISIVLLSYYSSDERDHVGLSSNKYDVGYFNNSDQALLDEFQYNAWLDICLDFLPLNSNH